MSSCVGGCRRSMGVGVEVWVLVSMGDRPARLILLVQVQGSSQPAATTVHESSMTIDDQEDMTKKTYITDNSSIFEWYSEGRAWRWDWTDIVIFQRLQSILPFYIHPPTWRIIVPRVCILLHYIISGICFEPVAVYTTVSSVPTLVSGSSHQDS